MRTPWQTTMGKASVTVAHRTRSAVRWGCISAVLTLAACGSAGSSSGDDPSCSVPPNLQSGTLTFSSQVTASSAQDTAFVFGSSFVPTGTSCTLEVFRAAPNDPFSPATGFGCSCQTAATICIEWRNAATATSGLARLTGFSAALNGLDCMPTRSNWDATVPLRPGANQLTVTMHDGLTSASAALTITRP
jgi:hypothetical protein